MRPGYVTDEKLKSFVVAAMSEDVGEGDISSLAAVPSTATVSAYAVSKGDGIIAGIELAALIFDMVDSELRYSPMLNEGDLVKKGDRVFEVSGSAQSILKAERLVLNCMQRMSGIASYTHYLNGLISHTSATLLDTRKTTPNFRMIEKWAVKIGGGHNHRFGLFDMVMLKDNHIDYAGGIENAVASTLAYLQKHGKQLRVEVETRDLDEVKQAVSVEGVDVIMLDNMSPQLMKQAVGIINGRCETEASGGISEDTIAEVAESGVDFISCGALTHSYTSLDISLKADQ